MNPTVAIVLGVIAAFVCTILALVMITPAKKREFLNPFFKFVHDTFNFKYLIVEKILKFCYILLTLACIGCGFFMLFSVRESWFGGAESMAGTGILLMILGPIAIRLSYELLMMAILLVKNVIEINAKLKNQTGDSGKSVFAAQNEFDLVDIAEKAVSAIKNEKAVKEDDVAIDE